MRVTTDALNPERALNTDEVAELLGLHKMTLVAMRKRGEGPAYFRFGRRAIRYRTADVLAWRDARRVG